MVRLKIDYGIDLGTTNSAICRMEKGEPVIIKSDTLKDTMPSCVSINKKKSEGILSNLELQDILKVLDREDIKVMDELTYYKLAIHNKEPHQAILFHTNKNSNIGHWISCWTDKHNIIHHDNSFGNPPIIDIQDRVIKYDKSIEQSADSTSCGWYALLNLLYKGKIKSQPF